MTQILGIDLGTTYSAVAIPETRTGQGFYAARDCPGYTILLDKLKNRITPSVVAEDESGAIVTGYPAKNRAGLSPEPIMFAKRSMGLDVKFQLAKQGALTPEKVSEHILRALKTIAEDRLGGPVEDAVITVPAYFKGAAKRKTAEAGKAAGLNVLQLAPEPVAAALVYCGNDPRDDLRIMTYDLGGGTFDVAILEKRDGVLNADSIVAFHGDSFLGGYNFDKKLAFWIMDRLVENGYDLRLDIQKPGDRAIFAKLMIYAERVKVRLSDDPHYELLDRTSGIVDRSGKPVSVEVVVTRDDFEEMIRDDIERTIELCRLAMTREFAKRDIRREELDEIVMVGGSSRIPLVASRLEEEFGRKPRLIDPDLCVALGAAMLAGTRAQTHGRLKLNPIPKETDLPSLTVSGRVTSGTDGGEVAGCALKLSATDGSYSANRTSGENGEFVFDRITLAPEETTGFVLAARSRGGVEIASHRFSVKQTARPTGGGMVQAITNQLAKPVGLVTVDGIEVFAPARTPLPHDAVLGVVTADASGTLRLILVEGNDPLAGEAVANDIPLTLPVGSKIEITLTIHDNYQIQGRAYIPALGRTIPIAADLTVPTPRTLEELTKDLAELREKAEEVVASAAPGVLVEGGRGKRLAERLNAASKLLKDRAADLGQIQDCLDEARTLLQQIQSGWRPEPPRDVFLQKARETRTRLDEIVKSHPEVAKDGYDRRITTICKDADEAYGDQSGDTWKECFERLVKLFDQIDELGEVNAAPQKVDPALIRLQLQQRLRDLEEETRAKGRFNQFEGDFRTLASELEAIKPDAQGAMLQMSNWFTKFTELGKKVGAPQRPIGIPAIDSSRTKGTP